MAAIFMAPGEAVMIFPSAPMCATQPGMDGPQEKMLYRATSPRYSSGNSQSWTFDPSR